MKEIRVKTIEDVIEFRDVYEVVTVVDGKITDRKVFFTKSQVAEYIKEQG